MLGAGAGSIAGAVASVGSEGYFQLQVWLQALQGLNPFNRLPIHFVFTCSLTLSSDTLNAAATAAETGGKIVTETPAVLGRNTERQMRPAGCE